MIGWLAVYAAVLFGLGYLATESAFESSPARGIVLFLSLFVSIWTIGRILVNAEHRIDAVIMLVMNLALIIWILVYHCRNR